MKARTRKLAAIAYVTTAGGEEGTVKETRYAGKKRITITFAALSPAMELYGLLVNANVKAKLETDGWTITINDPVLNN